MGQWDTLEIIDNHKKGITQTEIQKIRKITKSSMNSNIRTLLKSNFIYVKEIMNKKTGRKVGLCFPIDIRKV